MNETIRVKNIFNSIANTSKRTEKEAIILEHKDDELFIETLKFLCNDFITTGISRNKISKLVPNDIKEMTLDLKLALKYISRYNTGRDQDIAWIQAFIQCQDKSCYKFLTELFTKTYKCGVTASTLNKILPNSVPEFSVMLAEPFEKRKEKVKGQEIIVTEKLDGMRIIAIKTNSHVKFYSRQGKEIEGLVDIQKDFLNANIPTGVYDGELIATGCFNESKDQYKATMKIARKKGNKTGLKMMCFDYIKDIDDFLIKGKDETPFIERKYRLEKILTEEIKSETNENETEVVNKYTHIMYHGNLYIGEDLDELCRLFEAVATLGGEGLMINIADAPYECKRVSTLLKYKEFVNADLKVTGIYEGTGANKGKLGGIYVNYKGFTDKVGSGFDKEERELFFNNPSLIVGKIVDIQYFEETTNQENDEISMRFATFKGIREDKSEESYEI